MEHTLKLIDAKSLYLPSTVYSCVSQGELSSDL
jgi:hypothetical protein